MKRKVILALLATMTLTVGSFGTAFAMNSNQGIVIQTSESPENPGTGEETPEEPEVHTHTWGDAYYVKDEDAKYESVKVVDQEAVYDEVKVVDQEAVYNDITERHQFCNVCNVDLTVAAKEAGMSITDYFYDVHQTETMHGGYHGDDVVVGQELVTPEISHMETVLVSPEKFHYEDKLVTPEKGHWEHKCADCGITENCSAPGTVIPGDPDTDENTDKPGDTTENTGGNIQTSGDNTGNTDENTQKPGTSTGDNSQTTTGDNTQISTGDNAQTSTGNNSQTITDDKTQSGNENTSNTENTENKSEDQKQNENKETTTADSKEQDDTTVTVSTEKKAPKTGDTSSLIYLATFAGSAVTGGTAFGLRKKLKK